MSEVVLVSPNPDWARLAALEAERFASLLPGAVVRVHHVGSTAIPGIWAKPVIDLMPEVNDITQVDARREAIEKAGYEFWGEYGLAGRRFCPRIDATQSRQANIHCYESGSDGLIRHLAFRNYLRAFPALAREYEAEKLRARALHPHDLFAYNEEKNAWIRQVELQALEWDATK